MATTDTQLADPAIDRIRSWLEETNTTMHALGVRMGFDEDTARKAVWQLLQSKDPRIGSLRRFAKASGIPMSELTADAAEPEPEKPPKKKRA